MNEDDFKQLIIDYKETFGGIHGERVLERLSKFCNENEPCIVRHDALGTAYNEGARSVILHIRKMLNRSPEERQKTAIRS